MVRFTYRKKKSPKYVLYIFKKYIRLLQENKTGLLAPIANKITYQVLLHFVRS